MARFRGVRGGIVSIIGEMCLQRMLKAMARSPSSSLPSPKARVGFAIVLLLMIELLGVMGGSVALSTLASAQTTDVDDDTCSSFSSIPLFNNNDVADGRRRCDDWNDAEDGTPQSQEWVEARYTFTMTSTTSISMAIQWDIHEFKRDDLQLDGVDFGLLPNTSGIPADILRNMMDQPIDGQNTVADLLVSNSRSAVEQLITGFGTQTQPVAVTLPSDSGQAFPPTFLNSGHSKDSLYETSLPNQLPNNVYEPPVRILINAQLELDAATFALTDELSDPVELERTLRGLLVMGSEVSTPFTIFTRPGHASDFDLLAPAYATVESASAENPSVTSEVQVAETGAKKARWVVNALNTNEEVTENVSMTLVAGSHLVGTKPVSLDREVDQGLGVDITLDFSQSDVYATLAFAIEFRYVDNVTMEAWELDMFDTGGRGTLPLVTSDGMRMAYHSGLLELDQISDAIPLGDLVSGIQEFSTDTIEMSPVSWDATTLNYTHAREQGCLEDSTPVNPIYFCTEGANAMNSTFPLTMRSSSNTFQMSIIDMIQGQSEDGLGPIDFSTLNANDLESILNGGIEVQADLGTSFFDEALPEELPPTEITINIKLPGWVQTKDGERTLTLSRGIDGTSSTVVGVKGTNPYDCRPNSVDIFECDAITNSDGTICYSNEPTCMTLEVSIDFDQLKVNEWSQEITLAIGGYVQFDIYRMELPDLGDENLTFDVLPSDLLRKLIAIASRDGAGEAFSIDVPSFTGEGTNQLALSDTGLSTFFNQIAGDIQTNVQGIELGDGFNADLSGLSFSASLEFTEASRSTAISDREPIRLKFQMNRAQLSLGYADGALILDTSASWLPSVGHDLAMTMAQSFLPGMALESSTTSDLEGVPIPPDETTIPVPGVKPVEFSMDDDTAPIAPIVTVKIKFPEGIGFKTFTSSEAGSSLDTVEGRQQLSYQLPHCGGNPGCATVDNLAFSFVVSWSFIMGELGGYALGAGGVVAVFIFSRVRKRKKKDDLLQKEYERATRTKMSEAEFQRIETTSDGGASAPPPPPGGGGGGWNDDNWGAHDMA